MNSIKELTIATRKSPLAVWQADFVAAQLTSLYPHLKINMNKITTKGDILLEKKLIDFGGKGAFIKELEVQLLNNEADIAVHSMKDFPPEYHNELEIAAILERENPYDAFISNKYKSIKELPDNAVIGTSSLRREYQALNINKSFEIKFLRGNVNTRLKKLDDGEYDAIILAVSGLKRLGLENRIASTLDFIPAIGQGALGIEIKKERKEIYDLIRPLNHSLTEDCVLAERALGKELGGNCQTPIGCYAKVQENTIYLDSMLGNEQTKETFFHKLDGIYTPKSTEKIGRELAKKYE